MGPPSNPPVPVGTLTVIDGETDSVIATYYFAPGVEPEQVAVNTAKGGSLRCRKGTGGRIADE